VVLPAHAIRNDVASLEDVANMLANHAMLAHSSSSSSSQKQQDDDGGKNASGGGMDQDDDDSGAVDRSFHVNELMEYIPRFQFGMDVNPRFTDCLGYEYTAEVTVFDMMACGRLVHGWLVDPIHNEAEAAAVGTRTYNEVMDKIIAGQEAESQLARLQTEIDEWKLANPQLFLVDDNSRSNVDIDLLDDEAVAAAQVHAKLANLIQQQDDLQEAATHSHLIQHFLHESSHQLTTFGLERLHETLKDDELCVFFRNNHFCTMCKHEKQLYLLVTDLGYANQLEIAWEKLDVVDGDTEFCNAEFSYNPVTAKAANDATGPTLTPEQLLAASSQKEADYHLALHLANSNNASGTLDEEEGQLMAAATEASLREYNGLPPVTNVAAAPTTPMFPPDSGIEVGVPIPNPAAAAAANKSGGSSSTAPQPTVAALPPINSNNNNNSGTGTVTTTSTATLSQEEADRLLAIQLAANDDEQPATTGSVASSNHDDAASMHLAQQLQMEEDQRAESQRRRAAPRRQQQQQQPQRNNNNRPMVPNQSGNCAIM